MMPVLDTSPILTGCYSMPRTDPLVAYVSTYPPRECGIATYCEDLVRASIASGAHPPLIIAMESGQARRDYRWPVLRTVDDGSEEQYRAAARILNRAPVDVVSIQHEFGIFGGPEGHGFREFLNHLEKPVVTTLHTVLRSPDPGIWAMTRHLGRRSDRLVTLNGAAVGILEREYGVNPDKIVMIHHGTPPPSSESREAAKERLGLSGRRVLLTFGLVSRGKGLEHAIRALPQILRRHPDVCYLIAGETHPGVIREEQESYREELTGSVEEHGIADSVRFVNRYLEKAEIISYLAAADVYLTPYLNEQQVASGTLAYAVAAGKAIVSTPYLHAQFLLGEGRGLFSDFADPGTLAEAVTLVLGDPDLQERLESATRDYGAAMHWPAVAARYLDTYREVCPQYPTPEADVPAFHAEPDAEHFAPARPSV